MTLNDVFDALCNQRRPIEIAGGRQAAFPQAYIWIVGNRLYGRDNYNTQLSVSERPTLNALIHVDTEHLPMYLSRWKKISSIRREFEKEQRTGYLATTFLGFTYEQVRLLFEETYSLGSSFVDGKK